MRESQTDASKVWAYTENQHGHLRDQKAVGKNLKSLSLKNNATEKLFS